MNEVVLDSLPNDVHQSAMNVINMLGCCDTIDQFNYLLKTQVIPLTNSHGIFYSRLHRDGEPPDKLYEVYRSSICRHQWESFLEAASLTLVMDVSAIETLDSHLALDTFCHIGTKCHDCPPYVENVCTDNRQNCAIAAMFDAPKPAIALYFCRITSIEKTLNSYDFELLQLLQATLLQTVKSIVYQRENQELKALLDYLSLVSDPFAVVRDDGHIVHSNQAFDQTVGRNKDYLSKYIKEFSHSNSDESYDSNRILSRLGNRLYEISVKPVSQCLNLDDQQLFFVRYSRLSDKNKHWERKLCEKGLSKRELEIAALLFQGLPPRIIAENLHLSFHTIRNHIKHIYQKAEVSSRSELMNWNL